MTEKFEYEGKWWLPDKPEEQIHGTLKFSPFEKAVLDLKGAFKIAEPEVIWGILLDGRKITLFKCFLNELKVSSSGSVSSFDAYFVFIGDHFQKAENIKFKRVSVHYSYVDKWANDVTGFDKGTLWDEMMKEEEIMIKYRLPQSFIANVSDDLKVSLKFEVKRSVRYREVSIREMPVIVIETFRDRTFKRYRNIIRHMQHFLSLGVGKPVYPLAIEGITEREKPIIIFHRSQAIPTPEPVYSHEMLFTFRDISDRFESFLRNWFKKADALKSVYDLYFGTLYNPHAYLEQQFLSLVQAIEAFHRYAYKDRDKYLTKDKYLQVKNKLMEAIPDWVDNAWKDKLKGFLKYGNEFSLPKRLNQIVEEYSEVVNKFINNKKNFVGKIVNTRNYLVHRDEELRECAASGGELGQLTQRLKALLEVCLLKELGFSLKEIKGITKSKIHISGKFIEI